MRPFNQEQEAVAHRILNEHFSLTGKPDGSEDIIRGIVSTVLDLPHWESKKNFTFWDFRTPQLGIEFKNHQTGKADPVSKCGKLVHTQITRQIKDVPQNCPNEALEYICVNYKKAVDDFANHCEETKIGMTLCGGDDRIVYFHTDVPTLNMDDLVPKWERNNQGTYNLYVDSKSTGDHVFTFWTNGNKLAIKLRIPEKENVHVFDLERTSHYERLSPPEYKLVTSYRENPEAFANWL